MVDETIIDYELVEAVIDLIDAQHGPGAILVFLPGTTSLPLHLLVWAAPNQNHSFWVHTCLTSSPIAWSEHC